MPKDVVLAGHDGECILYGSGEAEAKWTPCRFTLCPPAGPGGWDARELREAYRWNDAPDRWRLLAADGTLHRLTDSNKLPARAAVVCRLFSPGEPSPGTFVVPSDALDMIGIRARIGDETFDIQSLEGRRQIAANGDANPALSCDVAHWAGWLESVGEVAPEALAPRLGAGLSIEVGMRRMFFEFGPRLSAPAGVTADGLARWRLMQEMRAEMRDEWNGDDCARAMRQLAGVPVPSGVMFPDEVAATVEAALANDGDDQRRVRVAIALSRLTAAPLETLPCAQLVSGNRAALAAIMAVATVRGWTKIDERWTGLAIGEMERCLDDRRPGRRLDVCLMTRSFSDEGAPVGAAADMLLIADERGVHACCWPTWQREATLIHRPGGNKFPEAMPMVTAREIPSMDELHELAVRVRARRQEARHESEARPSPLPQPAM